MKKVILTLLVCILLTGCGKEKATVVSTNTKEETDISNKVTEKVTNNDNSVKYNYKTDLYNITVEFNYNDKFSVDGKYIKNNYYSVFADVTDYKIEYFDSVSTVIPDNDKFRISGYDAIRMQDNLDNLTLIRIDEHTVIYITARSAGFYTTNEIVEDADYQKLISDMKITVKKK